MRTNKIPISTFIAPVVSIIMLVVMWTEYGASDGDDGIPISPGLENEMGISLHSDTQLMENAE